MIGLLKLVLANPRPLAAVFPVHVIFPLLSEPKKCRNGFQILINLLHESAGIAHSSS